MTDLVFDLEELLFEAKGISDLLEVIASAGNYKVELENYSDGIELLSRFSFEHYKRIESLWNEMYSKTISNSINN